MLVEPGPSILSQIACQRAADGSLMGGRTGLHLSEVIHYKMVNEMGQKLGPYGELDGDSQLKAELGFVWERLLIMLGVEGHETWWQALLGEAWKQRRIEVALQQGSKIIQSSLELDGIHMTPDGLDVAGPEPVLEEYKLSWKSARKTGFDLLTDELTEQGAIARYFMSWLLQMQGYAHAWGVKLGKPVLTARLKVFWVAGDYSKRPGCWSQAKCYNLTFTESELAATWANLRASASELQRSKIALVAGESGQVPV